MCCLLLLFNGITLAEHSLVASSGSWECALCLLMHSGYPPPAVDSKPRNLKDDNLFGIPQHFIIQMRGGLDSGVERSTGPVC